MTTEPNWKRVSVHGLPDGGWVRTWSAVVSGVRVYHEEHFSRPTPNGERALVMERYYTTDRSRTHRTLEAALAACDEPIEPNTP